MGMVKSAMGIGGLLCLGIGDTIRVTRTADPVEEIYAAKKILKAAGLRKEGVNLIACPTCGRTRIDLIPIAEEVERRDVYKRQAGQMPWGLRRTSTRPGTFTFTSRRARCPRTAPLPVLPWLPPCSPP